MYLVGKELQMNWILRNTLVNVLREDYDIRLRPPKDSGRDVVYTNSAITAENFVAPTGDSDGWATYFFTPDIEGLWELVLTDGTESENTFYYEQFIEVQSPDNHIRKVVKGELI